MSVVGLWVEAMMWCLRNKLAVNVSQLTLKCMDVNYPCYTLVRYTSNIQRNQQVAVNPVGILCFLSLYIAVPLLVKSHKRNILISCTTAVST